MMSLTLPTPFPHLPKGDAVHLPSIDPSLSERR